MPGVYTVDTKNIEIQHCRNSNNNVLQISVKQRMYLRFLFSGVSWRNGGGSRVSKQVDTLTVASRPHRRVRPLVSHCEYIDCQAAGLPY